jgi:transposase-like protein
MSGKRRNHGAGFKVKVALAALKGDKTLAELSAQFQVHQSQILAWKQQLQARAAEVFAREGKGEPGPSVKDMQAKIGQLALENDFLSGALGRIGDASAKR